MHADLLTILRCYCGYRVKARLSCIISQDHERRCAIPVYYIDYNRLLVGNRIYVVFYRQLCYQYYNKPLTLLISKLFYHIYYDKCEIKYEENYGIIIVYKFLDIYHICIDIYCDYNNYYMTSSIMRFYKNRWLTIYKNTYEANDIYYKFRDIIESRIKLINIEN